MQHIKNKLKRIPFIKKTIVGFRAVRTRPSLPTRIGQFLDYLKDLKKYQQLEKGANVPNKSDMAILKPCIDDKTSTTPIDYVYFYQDSWCAGKVFENKPAKHVDIGSSAATIGIISYFTPTTMVDIRPLQVSLPGLTFLKGDILNLPFADNSVESLSSICVIEHIGLGRYGDIMDPYGTEKSARELARVLAKNGNLYVSVPIDADNKIFFNAHRAFTREYFLSLFKGLKLKEEKYIYGKNMFPSYDARKGFGTGLYHFTK